jgi:hypothetical protein
MKPCYKCGHGKIQRISRASGGDLLLSMLALYPYTCGNCKKKSFRFRRKQMAVAIGFWTLSIGLGLSSLVYGHYSSNRVRAMAVASAQLHADAIAAAHSKSAKLALTNRDVIELVRAGLNVSIVEELIRTVPGNFELTPAGLAELKREGVPEELIVRVIQNAGRTPSASQPESNPGREILASVP